MIADGSAADAVPMTTSKASGVSVVITACNEASYLADCLRSVLPIADEVILIDLESTDDLAGVVRSVCPSARIIPHERVPFVEQIRQWAMQHVSQPWVLVLDPDERVSPALVPILREVASGSEYGGVWIPRRTIMFEKIIEYSGWRGDGVVRFFRRDAMHWPTEVHDPPVVQGEIRRLPFGGDAYLDHINYVSVAQFIEKMNRYTEGEADRLQRTGRPFSPFRMVFWSFRQFWERYVGAKGYKDGAAGLVICLLMAVYTLVSYLKLWEREKDASKP